MPVQLLPTAINFLGKQLLKTGGKKATAGHSESGDQKYFRRAGYGMVPGIGAEGWYGISRIL